MGESDWLAECFEENRTHLRAVAYRMLRSLSEANDAVQGAWLRVNRSDTGGVENRIPADPPHLRMVAPPGGALLPVLGTGKTKGERQ